MVVSDTDLFRKVKNTLFRNILISLLIFAVVVYFCTTSYRNHRKAEHDVIEGMSTLIESRDGTGYPEGLRGEEIPLCARIMAVADVFDALVSKRVYKDRFPSQTAFAILEEESGQHFDPEIVDIFLSMRNEVEEYLEGIKETIIT